MMFHFLVLQFYFKNGQNKKENDTFLKKEAKEKENSATTMISVDGKGTVFPMKLELQGESFEKHIKKENFKKGLINLIETNHQIDMTSGKFVSSNNSFKSHLNATRFNIFLTL